MGWNNEQAANDLERYLLRKEPPAVGAVELAIKVLRDNVPVKSPFKLGDIVLTDKEPENYGLLFEVVYMTRAFVTFKCINSSGNGMYVRRGNKRASRDWKKVN